MKKKIKKKFFKKNLKVLKVVELPLPSLNPPKKKTERGEITFLQIMCEMRKIRHEKD